MHSTGESSISPARAAWFAALAYVLIYIAPLGVRPPVSQDEVRYGAIAHEMIESGDWVAPRFNDVRYFEKPILGYWLNATSLSLFGENTFALRLPTALAAGLTALFVFLLLSPFVSRFSACLASGIYLTTLIVLGVGTFAVMDSFLTFFLTGSLASYFLAYSETRQARRRMLLIVSGAFCAGAFLTKGFLGLAVPVLVAGGFLLARRDYRAIITSPWLPILTAGLLVLPWAISIHLSEPDFWHYFFWIEHIQRFAGDNAQHSEPFWYFLAHLPFAGWPWILLLPASVIGLRKSQWNQPLVVYLASWAILPLVFFSLSRGKLLAYILPCFPPLSALLAIGLESYLSEERQRVFRIAMTVSAVGLACALLTLLAAQGGRFGQVLFEATERLRFGGFAMCLGAAIACALVALLARAPKARLLAVAASGVALFLPLQFGLVPQRMLDDLAPAAFLARDVPVQPDTILVSDAKLFGATAWAFKRDDIYVLGPGEIAYGLSYPDSRHRLLDNERLRALLEINRTAREILIICEEPMVERIQAVLPQRTERLRHGNLAVLRVPPARSG